MRKISNIEFDFHIELKSPKNIQFSHSMFPVNFGDLFQVSLQYGFNIVGVPPLFENFKSTDSLEVYDSTGFIPNPIATISCIAFKIKKRGLMLKSTLSYTEI